MTQTSLHSICTWTFNPGKGGFVPANIRPSWNSKGFSPIDVVDLIAKRIRPRLPRNIELGLEVHYDNEFNEQNSTDLAEALVANNIYLAMATPGAHLYFGYGGVASLDPAERRQAQEFAEEAVELVYGKLRKAWHQEPAKYPSFVIWNGSFGYDVATPLLKDMYQNLKASLAGLCQYEQKKGGELYLAIEPKPNEGHPALLLPTVASAIAFWKKIIEEFGLSPYKKGINKELGHSEMIGLDVVNDTIEELDHQMLIHMHLNSQGYNDGIILGGPGKYDIDHGVRINAFNIVQATLIAEEGYKRWKGHDIQPRPYDNEEQAIERVIRSILSWEACAWAAQKLKRELLAEALSQRNTAKAEDLMAEAVFIAYRYFREMYSTYGQARL